MKFKKGFTLIELLVVIAIIAILATVVILNVAGARARAQDAKVKSDISQINKMFNIYITYSSSLPATIQGLSIGALGVLSNNEINSFVDDTNISLLPVAPIHPKQVGTGDCNASPKSSYCRVRNLTSSFKIYYYLPSNAVNLKDCTLGGIPLHVLCSIP